MSFAHRAAVNMVEGKEIERDTPYSADVPSDLKEWLPDLFDRFMLIMPWEKPKPVEKDGSMEVWLMDNTAFRAPKSDDKREHLPELQEDKFTKPQLISGSGDAGPSGWQAEFVACYFIKDSGKDLSKIVASVAKTLNIGEEDIATRKRISERLQPFADKVVPKRTVRVAINSKEEQTLGPSNLSGISSGLHNLHFTPSVPGFFESTVPGIPEPFCVPASTVVAEPTGLGIISDIDDTIKVTQTPSPVGILHETFVADTPEPVTDMPELYKHIVSRLNNPPFFYLSASPYNLYPFLRRFIHAHFPPGTMMLRNASWQNLGGLISSLTRGTQAYKADRISKIHAWFPHRRFVCIGDSTQSDAEAYGECARKFPGWIRAIYVRRVKGIAGMSEEKNSDARFETAFEGVDRGIWRVFDEAQELRRAIDQLAEEGVEVGGA